MKKILFIDDNTSLLEDISDALNFSGYVVLGASDGLEGIKIAKKHKPDLILCDILMPKIDGFEVYKQLKEEASTSLIPFIFLTALAEQSKIREAMKLGVDDYLIKPFLLDDLLKVVCIKLQKSAETYSLIQDKLNEQREKFLDIYLMDS